MKNSRRESCIQHMRDNPPSENEKGYYAKVAKKFGYATETVRKYARENGVRNVRTNSQAKRCEQLTPEVQAEVDYKLKGVKESESALKKKYKALLDKLAEAERERDAVVQTSEIKTTKIPAPTHCSPSATMVVLASDWHIEERVHADTVSGLNEFTLDIAKKRATNFFQSIVRLLEAKQASVQIDTLLLGLLGDFITGSIHDDLMEGNQLPPIEALILVQNMIASGIEFLLENTEVDIICPCHSGNHGRATKQQRIATERGNSFEYYMYHQLANYFRGNERIKFLISGGYHSYVDVAGFIIRFHHGHQMKYGGGVGGLFIPARKAVSQWNKARKANIDCFGHFHQFKVDFGNFICNGSLIGYAPYALSIKADYEAPSQTYFFVGHKRKEIMDIGPIWLD